MKDFLMVVPGRLGKCLAAQATWVSAFSTEISDIRSSCFACKRIIIWGIIFSAWWFVHASAIVLAWPKSRSWFSVFKDLKEASSYCVGAWEVRACR